MKKKFTSTLVNVGFNFIMADVDRTDYGWYDDTTKEVTINLKLLLDYSRENDYNEIESLRSTIIHELTHFFDYNFFKSWQYKQKDIHEHLATFTDSFYKYIEDIKEQVVDFLLAKGVIYITDKI